MKSLNFKMKNFKQALEKLKEVSKKYDENDYVIKDSIIQRFEFTYELAHKTLKEYIEYSGINLDTYFPRTIFKEAYANKVIDNEQIWLKIIEDRNSTSHMYNENLASEIADRIVNQYVSEFEKLSSKLEELI